MSKPKPILPKLLKALSSQTTVLLSSILTLTYVTISDAFTRYVQGCFSSALVVPFYNYNPVSNWSKNINYFEQFLDIK